LTGKSVSALFSCGEFKESDKLFHEARMPGAGHRFYFVGRVPFVFSVLFSLLFVNTFLMLFLEFAGKHLFSRNALGTFRWYQDNSITIQFILLAFVAVVVFIFRKRIRWNGQK
jgi:hypothetical protein